MALEYSAITFCYVLQGGRKWSSAFRYNVLVQRVYNHTREKIMKIVFLISSILALTFVSPVFSAVNAASDGTTGANFEQEKADQTRWLDEGLALIQREKSCVQASTSHEDLNICREKFKAERRAKRPARKG
jgi:hypothetical protein